MLSLLEASFEHPSTRIFVLPIFSLKSISCLLTGLCEAFELSVFYHMDVSQESELDSGLYRLLMN